MGTSGILHGRRLIGVVHLAPTPGAPGAAGDGMEALLQSAESDAAAYADGGIDALVVENFGDAPFEKDRVAPETVAALALAVERVRRTPGIEAVGVNVLRNDARAALGVAAATGARFVRVNVHSGSMYTDQGLVEGRAAETLRTRAALCPDVLLFADVHVKHATPVPGERIEDAARDALHRGRADALIVSGVATGHAPDAERIARVREAVGPGVPIVVGSGLDASNARDLLAHADAAIVGTAAKVDGDVARPVDPARVRALLDALGGPAGPRS